MRLSDWHERYKEQARWTKAARDHLLSSYQITPADNLLEIGCGTGAVLYEMAARCNARHFGLDIDYPALGYARSVIPSARLICGNGLTLPVPANSMDMVYCHFLLLWVEDPRGLLTEARRVLKPGAPLLLFGEPDYGGRIDYPRELEEAGQIQTRSLRAQGADPYIGRKLLSALTEAGFEEVKVALLGGEWSAAAKQSSGMEQTILEFDLACLGEKLTGEQAQVMREPAIRFVPTFYAQALKPV